MSMETRKKRDFGGFKSRPRKAVRLSRESLVKTGFLDGESQLPRLVEPAGEALDLVAWAAESRDFIDAELVRHGALLFRGFKVPSVEEFERFVAVSSGDALNYTERSSPRSQVAGKIFTSTDHPPEQPIFLHNEQSYNLTFPLRIVFHSIIEAARGGETPIADCRKVYERLGGEIRERFARDGYIYERNFGSGLGLSWQEAFQTSEPDEVEAYCRGNDIELEWRGEGRLRTRQTRRAVARHPVSGELSWCNHATFFHHTTLEPEVVEMLLRECGEDALPNNTYYGDGSPIEPEVLDRLRQAYLAEKVVFPWRKGDVLLCDNLLVTHGREPFEGERKVVVGMARPVRWAEVRGD